MNLMLANVGVRSGMSEWLLSTVRSLYFYCAVTLDTCFLDFCPVWRGIIFRVELNLVRQPHLDISLGKLDCAIKECERLSCFGVLKFKQVKRLAKSPIHQVSCDNKNLHGDMTLHRSSSQAQGKSSGSTGRVIAALSYCSFNRMNCFMEKSCLSEKPWWETASLPQ